MAQFFGTPAGETVRGGSEFDYVHGLGGDDVVSGWTTLMDRHANANVVVGGGGRDRLLATRSDQLWGDDQAPRFVFARSWTGAWNGYDGWHVGDFNGDGRSDVFRVLPGTSGADMFLSDSIVFQGVGSWTAAGDGSQGWYVRDFDGDGRSDIFRYQPGVSGAEVFLSTGSSFAYAGSWTGAGNDGRWTLGDFDGDGRTDILRYNPGVSGAEVFLSTGSSFAYAGSWTGAGNGTQGWYTGDFNGDGRSDLLRYTPGVSGAEVFLSTGSSFAYAGSWTGAGNGPNGWRVGDYDGDGRSDLLRDAAGAEVFLSNGSGFAPGGLWTAEASGPGGWYVGNVNGAGGDDIFRYQPGASGALVFLANTPFGPTDTGPAGADVFSFGAYGFNGLGQTDLPFTRVMDFRAAGPEHDFLEFRDGLFTSYEQVMARAFQDGPNTVITYIQYEPGGQIPQYLFLENVRIGDLTPAHFVFA